MKTTRLSTGLWTGAALAALVVAGGVLATVGALRPAQAAQDAAASKVDDFMLPDQNFLAHQLYRMSDAKAVVLVTYAEAGRDGRLEQFIVMPAE